MSAANPKCSVCRGTGKYQISSTRTDTCACTTYGCSCKGCSGKPPERPVRIAVDPFTIRRLKL